MSQNENVLERTPEPPVPLMELAASILEEARRADSGRAAVTLTPSPGGPLKQTVVAVGEGLTVGPEHWNGPASLYVLVGSADVPGLERPVDAGTWAPLPGTGSEFAAREDLVALLTVVPDARGAAE